MDWIAAAANHLPVPSDLLDEKYAEHKDKKQQNFEGFQSKFEAEDKDVMKLIKTELDMMVLNR